MHTGLTRATHQGAAWYRTMHLRAPLLSVPSLLRLSDLVPPCLPSCEPAPAASSYRCQPALAASPDPVQVLRQRDVVQAGPPLQAAQQPPPAGPYALGILVQLSRRHAHPPLFTHDSPSLPYPCPSSPLLPAPHSAAASRHQHRPSRPSRPPSPPPAGLLAGGRLPRPGRVGAGGGVRLLWPRVGPRPAGR